MNFKNLYFGDSLFTVVKKGFDQMKNWFTDNSETVVNTNARPQSFND